MYAKLLKNKKQNNPESITGSVLGQLKLKESLRPRLYGEKLSRATGSPSQPSQLYRAFIREIS